jgi:SAM-dependent methyltransferase
MKISALMGVTDRALPQAGLDIRKIGRTIRSLPGFVRDARAFWRQCAAAGVPTPDLADLYPFLGDAQDAAGVSSGHYFLQDLWAAKKVFASGVGMHCDVGSRVDGFVSSLLVFCRVAVVDVRPLPPADGLMTVLGDAMSLPFADGSVGSLSSLHAMEHVGLGRYGDPIEATGTDRAMAELARVVAPGGRLYFSVPVGRERTMFNAQRILSPHRVARAMSSLQLIEFSAIGDDGRLTRGADLDAYASANYACGLFELRRPA